jgi:DNA end-binding protein Ku
MDGVLVMEQLHYQPELRNAGDVPVPDVPVKEAELTLAKQLIEQTSTDEFHPEKYHDTVRERVLEAIQQKVEGQEITAEPEEKPETKIIDLMDALKASLSKREGKAAPAKKSAKSSSSESPKPAKKRARKAS